MAPTTDVNYFHLCWELLSVLFLNFVFAIFYFTCPHLLKVALINIVKLKMDHVTASM